MSELSETPAEVTPVNGAYFSPDWDFWDAYCKRCIHGGDEDPFRCSAFAHAYADGAVGCLRIVDGAGACTQYRDVGKPDERQVVMDL